MRCRSGPCPRMRLIAAMGRSYRTIDNVESTLTPFHFTFLAAVVSANAVLIRTTLS